MRKMILIVVVAALAIGGCTNGAVDVCKYSAQRRQAYTTAIAGADLYAATHGGVLPAKMEAGRQVAVALLDTLNANCPPPNT